MELLLPRTLASEAERESALRYANNMLGVGVDYIVPGFVKNGRFIPKEQPHSSLSDKDNKGGSTLAAMVDARHRERGDVPVGTVDEGDVELFGPERYVQRKQESAILRQRRLIVQALQPCEDDHCRQAIVDVCLRHLRRAVGIERDILASWAHQNMRAMGFKPSDIRKRIAGAMGASDETARKAIARGDAELEAARREAGQAVRRSVAKNVKPDLREIEVGSIFDTESSALAISRMKPDHQRALVRAIEQRFTMGAIDAGDAVAKSSKIRLISRGMQIVLEEIGRDDLPTRDMLGQIDAETGKKFVVACKSDHIDATMGLRPDEITVARMTELLGEITRQLRGETKRTNRKSATKRTALKKAA